MNQERSKKIALVFGATGQDGSYLIELLLGKDYEVHGVIRRASTFNTSRIDHLYQDPHVNGVKMFLHYGDLADANTIRKLIYRIKPDEIYNLGAQSHVRVSFDIPEYTANITALGALRVLEAIKDYEEYTGKKVKFYQASSSEMFGAAPPPQNENTPFQPRSPYGISKVFAFYTTKNYREAYGIFAVNGILFNHETVASFMPMFCKKKDEKEFDIRPISEIVEFDESVHRYQSKQVSGIQVWGEDGWVDATHASAYPHDIENDNKKPRFINARIGAYLATSSHIAFMDGKEEKKTAEISIGDRMEMIDLPDSPQKNCISEEEAELMGMMVGDGSYSHAKRGIGVYGKFTNSSPAVREYFDLLWRKVTRGSTRYHPTRSGFKPEKVVGQLILNGNNEWLRKLDMYNRDRTKRAPKVILNAPKHIMTAFLRGYNATDGLKSNPCVYEFRNFKTNSATLAMGLWYLIDQTTEQDINLTVETKDDGRIFYSLNILSTVDNKEKEETVRELIVAGVSQRGMNRMSGISRTFIRKIQRGGSCEPIHHLRKDSLEVKKIVELPRYQGWFYDLETSSGEFHCGIGKIHVHNSPRRGETFVTKKVTRGIARILAGLDKKIYLGNLEAKRDWGYAPEYMEAAWLMMQQPAADDYVVGTGENHSVKEFVEKSFGLVGISDWQKHIDIDPRYYRPTEVGNLVADARKAKEKLGWQPKIRFDDLVKIMLKHDLEKHGLKDYAEKIQL